MNLPLVPIALVKKYFQSLGIHTESGTIQSSDSLGNWLECLVTEQGGSQSDKEHQSDPPRNTALDVIQQTYHNDDHRIVAQSYTYPEKSHQSSNYKGKGKSRNLPIAQCGTFEPQRSKDQEESDNDPMGYATKIITIGAVESVSHDHGSLSPQIALLRKMK